MSSNEFKTRKTGQTRCCETPADCKNRSKRLPSGNEASRRQSENKNGASRSMSNQVYVGGVFAS